jgi:preprotein translocase subunit SecF
MLNIIGKRYLFFFISFLMIVPGLAIIAINGLPLSIDFLGGSMVEVEMAKVKAPTSDKIVELYNSMGITDSQVQTSQTQTGVIYVIRSSILDQEIYSQIIANLQKNFDPNLVKRRFDTVSPTISQSVTNRAAIAVAIASLAVVLYIAYAFRGVSHAFRYGVCSIIALLHDILIVFSVGAIGSKFFGWQMDSLFLTALLTVIGFSTQDTIVVFDRIRENSPVLKNISFEKLVNHSVVQSLQRSINTQLMTSEYLLLALALFGGATLRQMCFVLLFGLLSGTYSSIFVAASILVVWENKEWKTWFRKNKTAQA